MSKTLFAALALTFLMPVGCRRQERIDTAAPAFTIQFVGTRADAPMLDFVLTNGSGSTLWYDGYGKSSPIYAFETRTAEGWQNQSFGWCGTGLERQTLRAGQSVNFAVCIPPAATGPFRVAVNVATDPNFRESASIASDPPDPADLPPAASEK